MSARLTVENIDQLNQYLNKEDILMIYFDTDSWGVGKAVLPKLMDLADRYKVKTVMIDIDKEALIRGQYQVFSAPTVLIMRQKKEVLRESKFINFENVERVLESLS